MTRIAASFVIAAALAASVAIAQPLAQDRFSNTPERPVRVQLSINFFVPGSINEASEETSKVREQARRIVYDMAVKECSVLQSAFARDCRLEAVNVNINRQAGQPVEGFLVSGSMTYVVTLK